MQGTATAHKHPVILNLYYQLEVIRLEANKSKLTFRVYEDGPNGVS
jgi:hypothetical protein